MEDDYEAQLLAGVRRGEPDWESIYRTYRGVMWAAAARVLRSTDRAFAGVSVEDVVHHAMTELTTSGLDPDTRSIPRLLATVAARRAMDARRNAARTVEAASDGRPSEEADPVAEAVLDTLLAERVARRLNDLPPRERIAVEGRVLHGLPAAQVGEALGVTPQRVSQLAAAGLRRLKAALDQEGDGRW